MNIETPILWPPDAKSWLIGKDPDAGNDWRQEKGTTEDEMVGWHHWLNAHGFGWTPGVGDGQGGLACCGSWGSKEWDTIEQLNWTELNIRAIHLWFHINIPLPLKPAPVRTWSQLWGAISSSQNEFSLIEPLYVNSKSTQSSLLFLPYFAVLMSFIPFSQMWHHPLQQIECLYVLLPKSILLNPDPSGDTLRRWGHWQVIASRGWSPHGRS